MTLSQRRERTRAVQGFGGQSLVELYEEKQWQRGWFHRELTNCRPAYAAAHHAAAAHLEEVIQARLKTETFMGAWEMENPQLLHGVPDAVRTYQSRVRYVELPHERCPAHFEEVEPCPICAAYISCGL